MNEYWMCDDDIRNDIFELSEFSKLPQPAPEPSEYMKKLRGKPSIFDDDLEEEEPQPVPQYLPVRGHPLLKNGVIIRKPGGRPTFNESQTSALIREVTGFGYGNDLIEHAFKVSNSEDEREPDRMKKLAFDSSLHPSNGKRSGDESDSSTSASSEYISFASKSSSSSGPERPDIYDRKEFPDLK
ncbi:hypothetical protein Trydic_g3400 [Trypoxylus dichotomus]